MLIYILKTAHSRCNGSQYVALAIVLISLCLIDEERKGIDSKTITIAGMLTAAHSQSSK